MKILVTGGTGYIGSHTAVELIQSGFKVIIVDNLSNSTLATIDRIKYITGIKPHFEKIDLADCLQTDDFFRRHKDLDAIMHFAAYKAVGESVQNPLKYYQNNLYSLIHILKGMIDHQIHHIVFSSSCTVYGQPHTLPINENTPIQKADSPYGNTKQIAEEIIADTIKSSSLNGIALRYFNPIGAHESALIGELPIGVPNNLMPYITQTAIGLQDHLRVFGDDYNTPDGTAIRDYIHVVDLAKAHVVAADRMSIDGMKTNFEVFNLGTGKGFSVLEVIRSFEKTSGMQLKYKFQGRRPGDVERLWADTSYANRVLGWRCERDLDEMTSSAWQWQMALAQNTY